ncbi:GMC family oxidoreductase N-terminal domain-containing protein [Brucella abortus]|nr:GMC family oxidoreductase N-terminal domain-containing protein [Brucella abortus]
MKNRVLRYTQAKVIGGGSSINAQIYTRGNAADYDLWADEEGSYRLGLSQRAALFQSRRGQSRVSTTIIMPMAGRLAFPCHPRRCRSAMLYPRRAGAGHPV